MPEPKMSRTAGVNPSANAMGTVGRRPTATERTSRGFTIQGRLSEKARGILKTAREAWEEGYIPSDWLTGMEHAASLHSETKSLKETLDVGRYLWKDGGISSERYQGMQDYLSQLTSEREVRAAMREIRNHRYDRSGRVIS